MKKTIVTTTLMAVAVTCLIFSGCGKKEAKKTSDGVEIAQGTPAIEDCVEIPEWKGIKLTKVVADISDDEVNAYALSMKKAKTVKDDNATVEKGDTANIDYVGKVDGKKFDGGSAQKVDLIIGSGSYIPGFEDGIIGMKKGETKTVKVTFPDNYSKELSKKDAEFKVTVNKIKRPDPATDKELEQAEANLKESKESDAEYNMRDQAWSSINNGAKWKKIPQEYLDKFTEEYDKSILSYSDSIEAYLKDNKIKKEDYKKERKTYAEDSTKNLLLCKALQKAMNIKTDSKEYKDEVKNLASSYGMSVDDLKKTYGESLESYVLHEIELEKIIKEAKIEEKKNK